MIFIPLGAALLRCMVGADQIRRLCGGRLPVLRQCALAIAIVLVLIFEGILAVLVTAGAEAPWQLWLAAGGFYFFYIGMCLLAFMPPRDPVTLLIEFEDERRE
ncbi:MAG: hypothetical protein GC162_18870 [Planctomycetes bacterium]|nr:hypothetical protein [Planctomycetota bacterium]